MLEFEIRSNTWRGSLSLPKTLVSGKSRLGIGVEIADNAMMGLHLCSKAAHVCLHVVPKIPAHLSPYVKEVRMHCNILSEC